MKYTKIIFLGAILTILAFSLNAKTETKTTEETKLKALSKFTKILGTVEKYYVDEIEFEKIIDKSINGLLENLDAHSGFLNTEKYQDLKVQTDGEFGGLGITVGLKDGAITIIAPLEDTPAYKAGLKAKDIILKIDSNSTLNMTIDEAVKLMRGKPKTPITLTIVRKGESKPFDVKLKRDIIKVDSVYAKQIENENGILYIRVTNFDKNVKNDVEKAIKSNKNIKGIILDLRSNPGGLLNQAVDLADLFIDDGVIVSQKGRFKSEDIVYKAKKTNTIFKKPLVVLVDGGSASASEIVAGALQDHKRAIVIGENTFGKGSVQVVLPIDNKEALKLTVARYYLPSERTIQAVGITPDIEAFYGKAVSDQDSFSLKENDLKQHLQTELDKVSPKKDNTKTDIKDLITKDRLYNDNQLKTALDILKTLILVDKN